MPIPHRPPPRSNEQLVSIQAQCTRQRCTDAPANTAAIACRNPRWASAMTICTPPSPRALQTAQELRPERAVLTVADGEPEHLTAPVGRDTGAHDHGLGHNAAVDPSLAVGGVEEHVPKNAGRSGCGRRTPTPRRPGPHRSATPRTWRSRCPRPGRGPGRRPCGWRLRAGRPPSPRQTTPGPTGGGARAGWARTSRRSFGMRSSKSPAVVDRILLRWPLRWLVRVSVRSPRPGTDHRGELGLDQGLVDRFGRLAHPVTDLGDRECPRHLEQGRLVQGHRVSCPSARTLVGLADRHTVAPQRGHPRRLDQELHHVLGHNSRIRPSRLTDQLRNTE